MEVQEGSLTLSNIISSVSFGLTSLLAVIIVLALGYLANRASNMAIENYMRREHIDNHIIKTSKKISAYAIYGLTIVAVLGVIGVPATALGTVVGLLGLGLSFAMRNVIENFISGIFLLVNQEFKIGDQIEVDGHAGVIEDIQIRASEIRTFDGRQVIVPNSKLFSNIVTNYTAYSKRRFEVIVGIGYEDDIRKAREIALEVLNESDYVEEDPDPQVLVDSLDDSSVNLKLRGWTRPQRSDVLKSSSEVANEVKDRFEEEGINIPFPIRTVQMED